MFAILFGVLFREDVPIKNTFGGNIAKGLLYGVIMTIISAGLLVPYAYVPNQGYGLFLFDGPDGWKLPFAILVWHLIYGLFLGLLYQPTRVDVVDDSSPAWPDAQQRRAGRSCTVDRAARHVSLRCCRPHWWVVRAAGLADRPGAARRSVPAPRPRARSSGESRPSGWSRHRTTRRSSPSATRSSPGSTS